MSIARHVSLVLCAAGLAGAFCSSPGQVRYRPIDVAHGGTVQGAVCITSCPSTPASDRVTKDGAVCGKRKPSPRLLTSPGKGVRFAVVWIDGITQGKKCDPPGTATLRQRNCEYTPHVLIVNPGDQLEIVNEDPILHNVHSYDVANNLRSVFNIAQPVRGFHSRVRDADIAGINAMMTTCDAGHPWMNAYIIRASSPYCTVTDADGKFRLAGVPPGTYTLRMWHEGIAARTSGVGQGSPPVVEEPYVDSRQITVGPDETVTVGFVFSMRAVVASQ
jgi:hypothetical protein